MLASDHSTGGESQHVTDQEVGDPETGASLMDGRSTTSEWRTWSSIWAIWLLINAPNYTLSKEPKGQRFFVDVTKVTHHLTLNREIILDYLSR